MTSAFRLAASATALARGECYDSLSNFFGAALLLLRHLKQLSVCLNLVSGD